MPDNCLKAISETDDELRVANYMVLFGGRDLEGVATKNVNADGSRGQYFAADTDFESTYTQTGRLYVDWEHGIENKIDPVAPSKADVLGYVDWATAKKDEIGLWVERVLNRRQKYMKYIETLIREGLIGNSIEATKKTIVASNGKIISCPLERDTLTVNPMEPRMMTLNALTALKSLALDHPELKALIPQEPGEGSGRAAKDDQNAHPTTKKTLEKPTMNDISMTMEEYKDLLKAQVKAPDAAPPKPVEAQDLAMKALSDRLEALTALIEKSPILKDAGYVAPDSERDHADTKSFGDFLVAVKNQNHVRLDKVYGSGEKATKAALAESAGATGGYIVPTQYVQPIMAAAAPFSVLRAAGATVIPMTAKGAQVPALDVETAPSAGDTAFAAGVVAYWTDEAELMTESEPRFRLIELVNHKLSGYTLASNEIRDDAGASIDALLSTLFGRAVGSKENYAFFRGDGVQKPLGIMNSGAISAQTRHTSNLIALTDVAVMMSVFMPSSWGKGAWFMNPGCADQLLQIVSAPLSYLPNLNDNPAIARLMGMPIYVTGALPALGTQGDFMLIDPSYYLIGDRNALTIAYSEHYKFIYDQATWRFTHRVDGQPWLDNTITLENASTTVSPFVALTTV